jgi:diguanylate cyclase (GGDEF)-like protein
VADEQLDALLSAERPIVGSPSAVPAALRDALEEARWLALPLRSGELKAGVLILRGRTAHTADDGDATDTAFTGHADIANALVAQAAIAYDRATLFARVQALAVVDELTGIANRRHFFDTARRDVQTCLRADRPLTAAMVDIDFFKNVNDTYGHPTGDDVIQTVSQRLASELRSTDLLGRYGGEEFAIVMVDVSDPSDLAERIRMAIASAPIATRSGPLTVTVSVGLAQLTPRDDLESVLGRADRALYRAKQLGRDRVCMDVPAEQPSVPAP